MSGLADELYRALVEAGHRRLRVGLGIGIEHIVHAGDVLGIDLRNAPHLPPRVQIVLGQASAHRLA